MAHGVLGQTSIRALEGADWEMPNKFYLFFCFIFFPAKRKSAETLTSE